jgi:endoglycosylceramidase
VITSGQVRLFVVLALAIGCSSEAPRWHISGGFLHAPDGRAVILRGANLSGAQKQSPYLDPAGSDDYRHLHDDWGMNAIRFVMTWAAVEPDRGRYDDAYLDQVAERLRWAEAAGLWVVLDMHEDISCTKTSMEKASASTERRAGPAIHPITTPSFLAIPGSSTVWTAT